MSPHRPKVRHEEFSLSMNMSSFVFECKENLSYKCIEKIKGACSLYWKQKNWWYVKTLENFLSIPGYHLIYRLGMGKEYHKKILDFITKLNNEGIIQIDHGENIFMTRE